MHSRARDLPTRFPEDPEDYSSTLTLIGCAITVNTAGARGGGLYLATSFAVVTVENSSTITGNTAPAGYGPDVDNLGTVYLDSTSTIGILDGNPPKSI